MDYTTRRRRAQGPAVPARENVVRITHQGSMQLTCIAGLYILYLYDLQGNYMGCRMTRCKPWAYTMMDRIVQAQEDAYRDFIKQHTVHMEGGPHAVRITR